MSRFCFCSGIRLSIIIPMNNPPNLPCFGIIISTSFEVAQKAEREGKVMSVVQPRLSEMGFQRQNFGEVRSLVAAIGAVSRQVILDMGPPRWESVWEESGVNTRFCSCPLVSSRNGPTSSETKPDSDHPY